MRSPLLQTKAPPGRRMGRPTQAEKEALDAHLLDVAERHFLTQGFEGTSMDRLALEARASKRTLYHRYAGKHALFEAVIERALGRVLGTTAETAEGDTIEDRLEHMALAMIERALRPDILALMRVVVAEAGRFTDLARSIDARSFERLVRAVSDQLRLEVAAGRLTLAVPLVTAAEHFLALTQTPLAMRALMGRDLSEVQASAAEAVRQAIPLFLVACSERDKRAPHPPSPHRGGRGSRKTS